MSEKYVGDCRDLDGFKIQDMVDTSIEVSYDELTAYVGRDELKDKFPIYDWNEIGLQLEDDPYVGFYKGIYNGEQVYFVNWSSIEFIWRKYE